MRTSALSESQQAQLVELLTVIKNDKGFIPDSCYELVYGLMPVAVIEVMLYDDEGRFLLKYREDQYFKGWHVPGGRVKRDELVPDACVRHVREDKVADGVTDIRIIGVHPQTKDEHPYGNPFCTLVAARPVGKVVENDTCKWFRDTPPDLIGPPQKQDQYIAFFKDWFTNHRDRYALPF
ncbi:NUDIX hydrolase [Patescibacteria group bacterium]|nr:NUDIX hydrolase [Patescibacteria group bacterium]